MVRILAATLVLSVLALTGCQSAVQRQLGMVRQPDTGLMFGAAVEKNLFFDSSQFRNRKIKVTIRNTSGDPAFDLKSFKSRIEASYRDKGYQPYTGDGDFGIKLDVNVMRSGQIEQNFAAEFGFLGAAGGGIAGLARDDPVATAAGTVVGTSLGAVLGSFVTQDTYIIIAEVRIGITDHKSRIKRRITFGKSRFFEQEEKIPPSARSASRRGP